MLEKKIGLKRSGVLVFSGYRFFLRPRDLAHNSVGEKRKNGSEGVKRHQEAKHLRPGARSILCVSQLQDSKDMNRDAFQVEGPFPP